MAKDVYGIVFDYRRMDQENETHTITITQNTQNTDMENKQKKINTFTKLYGDTNRNRILALFLTGPNKKMTVRQIRNAIRTEGVFVRIQEALKECMKLDHQNLLREIKHADAPRKYTLNTDNPIAQKIHENHIELLRTKLSQEGKQKNR